MTSEDIIENLGPFGYWQRVIFVALSIPDIFISWALLLPVFTGATPNWSCAGDNNEESNLTTAASVSGDHVTALFRAEPGNSENCTCSNRVFHGDFTSIVSEFDLVCDKSFISEMITSIQFAGLLVGAALFAQLSDLYGRKKTYFSTLALLSLCSLISSFSVNWQMYAVFKFFAGVSAGGYLCISCVYPLEFVGRRWRTLCGTLGFWAIGEMILAFIAYFIRDWRHLTICTSAAGFIVFLFWWIIPDSPRWLARSGHIKEAQSVYNNIAAKNGLPPPDLSSLDKLAAQQGVSLGKKYTYLDLFRTKEIVKITVINIALWFTTFLTYYNTSFNLKNLSGDRYLNMFLAGLVDIFAMFSVIIFNNIIGRRISEIVYVGIAALCNTSILIIYVTGNAHGYGLAIKISALIGKASALAGTYVMQIWSAELFPTHIRNLGVGVGSVAARVGSLLAPQIVLLGYYYEIAPYMFTVVMCCLVLPLCFLLEETNGKALLDDLEYEDKQYEEDTVCIAENRQNEEQSYSTKI